MNIENTLSKISEPKDIALFLLIYAVAYLAYPLLTAGGADLEVFKDIVPSVFSAIVATGFIGFLKTCSFFWNETHSKKIKNRRDRLNSLELLVEGFEKATGKYHAKEKNQLTSKKAILEDTLPFVKNDFTKYDTNLESFKMQVDSYIDLLLQEIDKDVFTLDVDRFKCLLFKTNNFTPDEKKSAQKVLEKYEEDELANLVFDESKKEFVEATKNKRSRSKVVAAQNYSSRWSID